MGGRDQSQVKIKFKKFEKVKSVPKDVPKSHNDDNLRSGQPTPQAWGGQGSSVRSDWRSNGH